MPKTDSAFSMEDIVRISDPMQIGQHEWRLVALRGTTTRHKRDPGSGRVVGTEVSCHFVECEWRRCEPSPEQWRRARNRPRYDVNDGQHLGLVRTPHKLWERGPWAHNLRDASVSTE